MLLIFRAMYQQHNTEQVREILASYRIGRLKGYRADQSVPSDPYKSDPHQERLPALTVLTPKPFNAETPNELLVASAKTPNDLFYVRNHLPVPEVDLQKYVLQIQGEGVKEVRLTLDELKSKFRQHKVAATLQCAGNRRSELMKVKPIKGLEWRVGGIGNAEWTGVLLRDVLQFAGLTREEAIQYGIKHIQFEGLDRDVTGTSYGASIPIEKALAEGGDVLLAFEMNGQPLSRDHGFPVRVIVPGVVAARHVKWLSKIVPSRAESDSHWQQRDYKSFSPNVDWDNVDWSSAPAMQDMPVTSAICEPNADATLTSDSEDVSLKGYAWSGGGRKIIRVDVSADGGKSWTTADLIPSTQSDGRAWAWTHWAASVPLPRDLLKPGQVIELVCKATDSAYNSQPDSLSPVWNLRGVTNNAWHRIKIPVRDDKSTSSTKPAV